LTNGQVWCIMKVWVRRDTREGSLVRLVSCIGYGSLCLLPKVGEETKI